MTTRTAVPQFLSMGLVLVLGGCATRPTDITGTGTPGPVGQIDAGQGVGIIDGGAMDDIRILPPANNPRPQIPRMLQGRQAHIWFFDSVSRDRKSVRQGFWVTRALEGYRWDMDLLEELEVPLEQGATGGTNFTSVTAPDSKVIEPQQSFLSSWGDIGQQMPWSTQTPPPATTQPVPSSGK